MTDHLTNAADRAAHLMEVRDSLNWAVNNLTEASDKSHAIWDEWTTYYREKPGQIDAVKVMLELVLNNVIEDIYAAVTQAATLLVRDHIAPAARESVEPVEFITGNRMMPPMRNFDAADTIWTADQNGDVWERFAEALDSAVNEHNILLASPEYDNALYVVDLARWQHVDEADMTGDSLNDEWEPIVGDDGDDNIGMIPPKQ